MDTLVIGNYDIILEKLWLYQENPLINWWKNEVTLFRNNQPHTLKSIKDIKLFCQSILVSCQQFTSQAKTRGEVFAVLSTPKPNTHTPSLKIQRILNQFIDVFPDDLPKELPPTQKVDHEMTLELGTEPPFRPIYQLSQPEMQELEKQLKKMIFKEFI